MSEKIKICLVSPLPPPLGGIGLWTTQIHRWAASNPQIHIDQIDISPRWRTIDDTVRWKRVIGGGMQFVRDILCFYRLLMTRRFDVVHLTTSGQLAIIRDIGFIFTAGLFKIPLVYHIRFGRIPQIAAAQSREWRLMSRVMLKAQTVIAIDLATYNAIREHLPAVKVTLIPNCINFAELPPSTISAQSLRTVLFVGWVIPTKGIVELIESWVRLKSQGWKLQIIGPCSTNFRQILIDQFRPDGIEFFGELSHSKTMDVMADCDLFVLPSYTEGFPNVILEAMALGKAIVATDVGAIPEMLDGTCGILVKPKDVQGLSTALQTMMNDANLRAECGIRASKRALANYSIDMVFAQYMTIWHEVAKKRELK